MATSFIGNQNLPIGLRNNNPGDLKTGILWQGVIGQEGGFLTFLDITWGIRALARDLITNINVEGYDTISAFITKFAPPLENNTAAYIADVSADTGLDPGEVLGTDQDTLHSMIRAIMNHELGAPYSAMIANSDIDQGIAMAVSGAATLPAAAAIALQNPGAMLQAVTPLEVAGIGAVVLGLLYFSNRKTRKL